MLVHRSIVFLEVCLFGLQADIQCSSIGRGSFLVLEGAVIISTESQLCHWGFGPKRVCVLRSVCSPWSAARGKYLTQADFCSLPSVISSVQQRLCKCQITEPFFCVSKFD